VSELIRRTLSFEVRGFDEAQKTVRAFVSTRAVDRHRTIFLPSAFARTLPLYLRDNPLFLWGHRWDGDPDDALGTAYDGAVVDGEGLELALKYDVDINPKADLVFKQVVKNTIRAFSIGCYILREVTKRSPREEIDALPDYAREALVNGECAAVFTDVELIEVSQVLIGSNREALVASVRAGLITPSEAQSLLDESEQKNAMKNAEIRLPVEIYDCAGRLENAANMLRVSNWYDETDAEHNQTVDGLLAVMDECRDKIAGMRRPEAMAAAAPVPDADAIERESVIAEVATLQRKLSGLAGPEQASAA